MAALAHLEAPGGEGPGFLFPLFRVFLGANHLFAQHIDEHNNVVAFEPTFHEPHPLPNLPAGIETDIGRPAIWGFRDHRGTIHVGDARSIERIGLELLESGALVGHPVAAADVVSFCKAETRFPETLRAAYNALADISKDGADIWRDTMFLMPAIKADIAKLTRRSNTRDRAIQDIVVVSRGRISHLYMPSLQAGETSDFSTWRQLAAIFGIDELQLHELQSYQQTTEYRTPRWTVLGIGGIARHVFGRAPFYGHYEGGSTVPGSISVKGPPMARPVVAAGPQLLIGIIRSNLDDAEKMRGLFDAHDAGRAIRHLVDIRPIGYGTPNSAKATPEALINAVPEAQQLWIVATHRLKQTGKFANSLSASNRASRFVRAAANGLIALQDDDRAAILGERSKTGRVGIFGAARYDGRVPFEDMVRRVLHNMLCEDVCLHLAKRIVMLCPYASPDANAGHVVKLGRYEYRVELIHKPIETGRPDQLGFAFDTPPSKRTLDDFRAFCAAILAAFNWTERHADRDYMSFENEGEGLRIWPAISDAGIRQLLQHDCEFGFGANVIITNRTVRHKDRECAKARKWMLIHYSEVDRWMRENYQVVAFEDW
ncbi:MAG: hypothetical protein EOP62_02415 [Sphingomonadales bacterium]|nr:MAG: hypothetical protein EOP62_02415 [Sphingomonadales bacterium]